MNEHGVLSLIKFAEEKYNIGIKPQVDDLDQIKQSKKFYMTIRVRTSNYRNRARGRRGHVCRRRSI